MMEHCVTIYSELESSISTNLADKLCVETEHDDLYVQLTLTKDDKELTFYCDRTMLLYELEASRQFAERCKRRDEKKNEVKP